MPIQSGSVTFSRYRVEADPKAPSEVRRWLVKGLKSNAFEEIDRKGDEDRAAGFVELENADESEFAASALFYGERALFAWRVDTLKVPSAALKAELEKWQAAFEKENGRKPSRGEKTEQKGAIRHMLRARATPTTKTHDVSWNLKTGELQLWTSSRKIAEEIALAMESAFDLKLVPVSPGGKAIARGIPDAQVAPTAALLGVELPKEVAHGEA